MVEQLKKVSNRLWRKQLAFEQSQKEEILTENVQLKKQVQTLKEKLKTLGLEESMNNSIVSNLSQVKQKEEPPHEPPKSMQELNKQV